MTREPRTPMVTDEIPESAQRALEHVRPTREKVFAELHGFAEAAGVEAELPATVEAYEALYGRLQEAGFRDEVRTRYGGGFEDVWRAYEAQFREWEREYRARLRSTPPAGPPLVMPAPTVLTRLERRRALTRSDWSPWWPLP